MTDPDLIPGPEQAFLDTCLEEACGRGNPPDLRARILDRVSGTHEGVPTRRRPPQHWAAALLLIGLGVVATIWQLQQGGGTAPAQTQDPTDMPRRAIEIQDPKELTSLLSEVEGLRFQLRGIDGYPHWVAGEQRGPIETLKSGDLLEIVLKSLPESRATSGTPYHFDQDWVLQLLLRRGRRLDLPLTDGVRQVGTAGTLRIPGIKESFVAPAALIQAVAPRFRAAEAWHRQRNGVVADHDLSKAPKDAPLRHCPNLRLHGFDIADLRTLLKLRGGRPIQRLDLRGSPDLRSDAGLAAVLALPSLRTLIVQPSWTYLSIPGLRTLLPATRKGLEELILLPPWDCYWKLQSPQALLEGDPDGSMQWRLDHPIFRGLTRLAVAAPMTDTVAAEFWRGLGALKRLRSLSLQGIGSWPQAALASCGELRQLREVYLLGARLEDLQGLGMLDQTTALYLSEPVFPKHPGQRASRRDRQEWAARIRRGQRMVLDSLPRSGRLQRLELNGWFLGPVPGQPAPEPGPGQILAGLAKHKLQWLALGDCPGLDREDFLVLREQRQLRSLVLAGHGLGKAGELALTKTLLEAIPGLSVISN